MTTERDDLEHAKENAKGWLASIEEMLNAPYKAAALSRARALLAETRK